MKYARGFLALQLRFAETVAEPAGLSLERALLDYTNLYIRFGIGRFNTEEEIETAATRVIAEVRRLRALSPFYRAQPSSHTEGAPRAAAGGRG